MKISSAVPLLGTVKFYTHALCTLKVCNHTFFKMKVNITASSLANIRKHRMSISNSDTRECTCLHGASTETSKETDK